MMDQFSLFDKYLQGQLSQQEVTQFCSQLMHDEEMRRDFRLYLSLVQGIRKEAQQDNIEVNAALLSLSLKKEKRSSVEKTNPRKTLRKHLSQKLN